MVKPRIEIEGFGLLQWSARKAVDVDLPRRLGVAHKNVGTFIGRIVDRESDPQAVGRGFGAKVRGSATKREVLIRVGHGGRERHVQQWGKTPVRTWGARAPARPFIVQIIDRHEAEIRREILEQVMAAMSPAFHSSEIT